MSHLLDATIHANVCDDASLAKLNGPASGPSQVYAFGNALDGHQLGECSKV